MDFSRLIWYNFSMINQITKGKIAGLAEQYQQLAMQHPRGVAEIELTELPEMVYNSNAIENSTLTLEDTEDILMRDQIRTDHEIREIYEAKNLAKVVGYLDRHPQEPFSAELILKLHGMLLHDINDRVAGRFRSGNITSQATSILSSGLRNFTRSLRIFTRFAMGMDESGVC